MTLRRQKKNDCSEIDFYGLSRTTLKASSLEYNLNRTHERQSANQSAFDNLLNRRIAIYCQKWQLYCSEGIKGESAKFTFRLNENSKIFLFISVLLFTLTQNVNNILFEFGTKKKLRLNQAILCTYRYHHKRIK